jgi:hypothetical protein
MSFLSKLLTVLTPVALNWLWDKLASIAAGIKAKWEAKKKREADNKKVREQTEAAETPEDRENALKNELRNS